MFITCHQHYLKSHFGVENLNILPFFTQRYNKVMLRLISVSLSNVLYCIYDVSVVSRCTLYLNKILFTLK